MTTSTESSVELAINTIRTLSMDAVQKANSGHPGTPMALAPLAFTLYTRVMKQSPENPDWFDRDRFVLSAGHASMLLYSTLLPRGLRHHARRPQELPPAEQPDGRAPRVPVPRRPGDRGHHRPARPGARDVGGDGAGRADARRPLQPRRHELIDHHTYVIASDGDIQEGVGSEASSLAGHLGLGKLIVFFDNNHIQLAGPTDRDFSEDVGKRYEAYGWHVQDVGEDLSRRDARARHRGGEGRGRQALARSSCARTSATARPTSRTPTRRTARRSARTRSRPTKEVYGWPPDKTFYVPDEAREPFDEAAERGRQAVEEWEQRLASFRDGNSEAAAELDLIMNAPRLPDGWDEGLPTFDPDDDKVATRKASGEVIQWAAAQGAEPDLRLGRPRALDADRDRGRRLRGARRLRRPQRALRRARARHGRDRQRPRPPRLPRVRLHVLQLPRLHEAARCGSRR